MFLGAKSDGEYLVQLQLLVEKNQTFDIQYWVASKYWGQGKISIVKSEGNNTFS